MRLGKTNNFLCDFCGKVISGKPHSLHTEETKHFCPTGCFNDHLEEEVISRVAEKVRKEVLKEVNEIHKNVCPSCAYRVRSFI